MRNLKIGVLCGSARRGSYNQKAADALAAHVPTDFEMIPIRIDDLPLFNQDYDDEGRTPEEWMRFREEIMDMDGFLFASPEYNRSYPPLLKNALDIGSRPSGQNRWAGKPALLITASPGKLGGFGANHHLRQVMSFLDLRVMNQPECYFGGANQMFPENGEELSESTESYLQAIAGAFTEWMKQHTAV
jgi:chromate reductase